MRPVKNDYGDQVDLVVVPEKLRKTVFNAAHTNLLAGHHGYRKTKQKMAASFYWLGMSQDVHQWSRACDTCQRGNIKRRAKAPLRPLPVITTRVAIDVVGPLPRTRRGYKYILTLMDFGIRYPEAIPIRRIDAEMVCHSLMGFGLPEELLSDNGTILLRNSSRS